MQCLINGIESTIADGATIAELLASKGIVPEHVVVEYNCRILDRGDFAATRIHESDQIEIVSFVGGG